MLKKVINKIKTHNMLCGIGESEIYENEIRISKYPFKPSNVYPNTRIKANQIDAICWDSYPPAIKIGDEYIFISREHSENLRKFSEINKVKTFKAIWTWQWLLEPYLDTEYAKETDKRLNDLLNKNGISNEEIKSIRNEVKDQMMKYNFDTMLWEWGGLGLEDVLAAMRAKYDKVKFEDFFKRAMEIQFRNIEYDT